MELRTQRRRRIECNLECSIKPIVQGRVGEETTATYQRPSVEKKKSLEGNHCMHVKNPTSTSSANTNSHRSVAFLCRRRVRGQPTADSFAIDLPLIGGFGAKDTFRWRGSALHGNPWEARAAEGNRENHKGRAGRRARFCVPTLLQSSSCLSCMSQWSRSESPLIDSSNSADHRVLRLLFAEPLACCRLRCCQYTAAPAAVAFAVADATD